MRKVIFLLLATGVLLATTAVTAEAQIPHYNHHRNHYSRADQESVRMGLDFGVNGGTVKWGVNSSMSLGLAELGLDVLCPIEEESKVSAFWRAGLRFSGENLRIGPDLLATHDEQYRLGIGCAGDYRFMEKFYLSVKVYVTYNSKIEESDIMLQNARLTLLFGVATDIF